MGDERNLGVAGGTDFEEGRRKVTVWQRKEAGRGRRRGRGLA